MFVLFFISFVSGTFCVDFTDKYDIEIDKLLFPNNLFHHYGPVLVKGKNSTEKFILCSNVLAEITAIKICTILNYDKKFGFMHEKLIRKEEYQYNCFKKSENDKISLIHRSPIVLFFKCFRTKIGCKF